MLDRILVATDGSASAQRAADHALSLAEHTGADLVAVFVLEEGGLRLVSGGSAVAAEGWVSRAEARGFEIVDAIVDAAEARGIAAKGSVRRDDRASEGILDHAKEVGADLIVMGTEGRSGVSRFVLGSVAERVLRQADRAVLVVPPVDR